MDKFVIKGGTRLKGEVTISGAKNAAVAILPATLLINGVCTIDNLPNISDVKIFCEILTKLGAKITWNTPNEITIDTRNIDCTNAPLEMTSKFRASYYLLGALLGRCGCAEVGIPGGCNLGARPIDQHIKGFEALGAKVDVGQGKISAKVKKLVANSIYMDIVSVGATINVMLASVLAEGTTIIDNAAKEPHIVDVANFLNTMGANIKGAGTDTIKITGVKELTGNATYSLVPDQIEAGTFMVAAAATGGRLYIDNVIPKHLEAITAKLTEMGVDVEEFDDAVLVSRKGELKKINIQTRPYPGFPTDMNPQIAVLMCIAEGQSQLTDTIWDNRFRYVEELKRMGAVIDVNGNTAVINGVKELISANVRAVDLRAGAAMIIAGLAAKGRTEIDDFYYVERGYDDIVEKLRFVGANIRKIKANTL